MKCLWALSRGQVSFLYSGDAMLSERSNRNLEGVHEHLVAVVRQADAITKMPFIITEGLRSEKRQRELFAKGLSKTLKSRHLTGHAVDFAPLLDGEVTWKTPAFLPVIAAFKKAAEELKIPIVSGGDWKSFKDFPHIELDRRVYP